MTGSRSGPHSGTLTLADDAMTVVFVPAVPFALGERVHVRIAPSLRARTNERLPGLELDFTIAAVDPATAPRPLRQDDLEQGDFAAARTASKPRHAPMVTGVPEDYPPLMFFNSNDPEPGEIFLTPSAAHGNLVIVDNAGQPLFYRKNPARVADFKVQPNGRLSYFNYSPARFYLMDSTYAVVDSFMTGNGYVTDVHDFLLLPNGHALLMSYDPQPVRMDSVVPGGDPNAIVTGLIIQELDAAKNVVFQWRSWDHFEITDGIGCTVNLLGALIDYSHGNAFEVDFDGNLLISSRHMNEITKISRQTVRAAGSKEP